MKKGISLLIIITLLSSLFLAACGGSSTPAAKPAATPAPSAPAASASAPAAAPKKLKIAHVTKTLTNPFFVKIKDAIESSVRPGDEITTYDCGNDLNKEMSIVEDCIALKYDAVILAPIDFEGTAVSIDKLKAAGIVCALIDSGAANMDNADFTVMADNFNAGYLAMKGLADALGGKGKVAVAQNSTSYPGRERGFGRDKALAENPGIIVASKQDGVASVDLWMNFFADALQKDPDLAGGWAINDPGAQMFIAAAETAGKINQVKIVGIDGSAAGCDLIREGKQLGSSAQFPVTMAKDTVSLLYKYIDGGRKLEAINGVQHIKMKTVFVDKSNVDTFGME